MSDEQNNNQNNQNSQSNLSNQNNEDKFSHLSEDQKQKAEKAIAKLAKVRALKKLNGNSKWTLLQEIFQEIVATHTISNPDTLPPTKQMTEELKAEIKTRYIDDEELRSLLLESIPSELSIRKWFSKDGWNEAVWSKIRVNGLFTKEKRSQMIDALWRRGVEKSDTAAKIWLTISGDYSEGTTTVNNKTLDTYREINKILHGESDNENKNKG